MKIKLLLFAFFILVIEKADAQQSLAGELSVNSSRAATITSSALSYGMDVSHYQGTINWPQVYAAGKIFAFAQATQGFTYNDATFSTNMVNGTNAGVLMGAYHLARPDNNTAANEANHFLSIAGAYIGPGYLPPALDLEPAFVEVPQLGEDCLSWAKVAPSSCYDCSLSCKIIQRRHSLR